MAVVVDAAPAALDVVADVVFAGTTAVEGRIQSQSTLSDQQSGSFSCYAWVWGWEAELALDDV